MLSIRKKAKRASKQKRGAHSGKEKSFCRRTEMSCYFNALFLRHAAGAAQVFLAQSQKQAITVNGGNPGAIDARVLYIRQKVCTGEREKRICISRTKTCDEESRKLMQ
jgi:hypothetical protein